MSHTIGVYAPNDEQIVLLQTILQSELHMPVTLAEAQEVGRQLVSLYTSLTKEAEPPEETESYERQ